MDINQKTLIIAKHEIAFPMGPGGVLLYSRALREARAVPVHICEVRRCRGHRACVSGDPYSGLKTKRSTFTLSAYGGSSWRWNDEHSFQYKNGSWHLINRLYQGFHGPQISEQLDDYITGVGTHWSIDDVIIMEWRSRGEPNPDALYMHKVEEKIKLGPPPTLEAFSREFAQEMYREN